MLDTVDDAVVAGTVLSIALPFAFQELAKVGIECQAVDGLCDLLTECLISLDEAVEFLTSEL